VFQVSLVYFKSYFGWLHTKVDQKW
jgi:hypothetical protein